MQLIDSLPTTKGHVNVTLEVISNIEQIQPILSVENVIVLILAQEMNTVPPAISSIKTEKMLKYIVLVV